MSLFSCEKRRPSIMPLLLKIHMVKESFFSKWKKKSWRKGKLQSCLKFVGLCLVFCFENPQIWPKGQWKHLSNKTMFWGFKRLELKSHNSPKLAGQKYLKSKACKELAVVVIENSINFIAVFFVSSSIWDISRIYLKIWTLKVNNFYK